MALTQEDRAVLETAKQSMLDAVDEKLAASEPRVAAQIKQFVEESWKSAETPAAVQESFTKFQEATQKAVDDLTARMEEQSQRRWRNSDDRLRVQGGNYDGKDFEMLPMMRFFAEAKVKAGIPRTSELDSVMQSVKATDESLDRDSVAAHFGVLQDRMKEKFGAQNPVIQSLEDMALGRVDSRQPVGEGVHVIQALNTGSANNFVVPTIDATMWADVMLMPGNVMSRIPQVSMPSPTYRRPHFDDALRDALAIGGTAPGAGGEQVRVPDSDPGLVRPEFNAATVRLASSITQDEMEDSVVNLTAALRSEMLMAGAYGLDNMLLNSDYAVAAQNINGALNVRAPSGLPNQRGIRYYAITTSGQDVNAGGNPTSQHFLDARALLRDAGVAPRDFFYVMNSRLYHRVLGITEFERYDAAERLASLITGQVEFAFGSPIIVSRAYPENVADSGRISSTPANNDTDSAVAVVTDLWNLGVYVPYQLMTGPGLNIDNGTTINPDGINFLLRGRYAVQHRGTTGVTHSRPASIIRNVTRS